LIRPALESDIPAITRVHIDAWRTTYRGIVPQSHLDALDHTMREQAWRESWSTFGRYLFVAELDGAIVGFANGGPIIGDNPALDAELYAIYLLSTAQRRGIGTALVRALAHALRADGHRAAWVWVLRENPACRFYESLGGTLVDRKMITIGGAELEEVAYRLPDLAQL
jgi:ribosomal protein S18 acetylase RimI-like enzyme